MLPVHLVGHDRHCGAICVQAPSAVQTIERPIVSRGSQTAGRTMIEGWAIILLALAYVSSLFALAWYADRTFRSRKGGVGRPLIYALSLAVYCTSWTFFGSVGF